MGEKLFWHDGFAKATHVHRFTHSENLPLVFLLGPNELINGHTTRQVDNAPHRQSWSWKDARQLPR